MTKIIVLKFISFVKATDNRAGRWKDTFELKLFHHDQQNNIIDIHLYGRLDKLKVSNKRMKIFMFYLISPCYPFFEC